jgi:polyhydroxyalkanoate synthesis repressor PhaR
MRLVKKYGNRRLYDTTDSSYVTLAEVAAKIRGGDDVRVVDAKTEEDLTAQTLAQIIFEDRNAARLLPVPLLQHLIRMGDDSLGEFFGRYLTWALDLYLQARQGLGALPYNPFAQAAFGAVNPLSALLGNPVRAEPPRPPPSPASSDELAALRREVEELKKSARKRKR